MTNDSSRTIIPAAPGWYVAMLMPRCFADDGAGDRLMLHPVLAWEIERHELAGHTRWTPRASREVTPLTSMGTLGQSARPWAIRSPDGQFDVGGYMIDNEADTIQALKDDARACEAVDAAPAGAIGGDR